MVNKEGAEISKASFQDGSAHSMKREGDARTLEATPKPSQREGRGSADYIYFLKSPKTCGSPGVFFASEDDSRSQGEDQKKKSGRDRSIPEGVGTTSLGARRAVSLRKRFLKPPKTGGSPDGFFVDQDKNSSQDGSNKKKLGREESVSDGVKITSLGRGGSRKIKFSKIPQTGGSPGEFFARQEDTSLPSPNSGKSPGKTVTHQDINNKQLAGTTQGVHSTEKSLHFPHCYG